MSNLLSKCQNFFKKKSNDWKTSSLAYKTFFLGILLYGNYILYGINYTNKTEKFDGIQYVYTIKEQKRDLENQPKFDYEWTKFECFVSEEMVPYDFEQNVARIDKELKTVFPKGQNKISLDVVLDHSISWLDEDETTLGTVVSIDSETFEAPYWYTHLLTALDSLKLYQEYGIEFGINSVTILNDSLCLHMANNPNQTLYSSDVYDFVEDVNPKKADFLLFFYNYPRDHNLSPLKTSYYAGKVNKVKGDMAFINLSHSEQKIRHTTAHEVGHLLNMVHPSDWTDNSIVEHSHDVRSQLWFRILIDPFFLLGAPLDSRKLCEGNLMKWGTTGTEICPKNVKRMKKYYKKHFKD